MAKYNKTNKETVSNLIESYTKDNLDTYIRDIIKKVADEQMDAGKTPQEVADTVYDTIVKNYNGNIIMAAMCNQIIPTSIALVLRNEIIKAISDKK